jgi:hypothetical protein
MVFSANAGALYKAVTSELKNTVTNSTNQRGHCTNTMTNINMDLDGCDLDLKQECILDFEVTISDVISATSNVASNTEFKQKASGLFDFNLSSTDEEIRNTISNKINNSCKTNEFAKNYMDNFILTAKNCTEPIVVWQTGNLKSSCALSTILDSAQTTDSTTKVTQTSEIDFTMILFALVLMVGGGGMFGAKSPLLKFFFLTLFCICIFLYIRRECEKPIKVMGLFTLPHWCKDKKTRNISYGVLGGVYAIGCIILFLKLKKNKHKNLNRGEAKS